MALREFPIFTGSDFNSWIYWLETYFVQHDFNDEDKLNLSQALLEGKAYDWLTVRRKFATFQTWSEMKKKLFLRFGDWSDLELFSQCVEQADAEETPSILVVQKKTLLSTSSIDKMTLTPGSKKVIRDTNAEKNRQLPVSDPIITAVITAVEKEDVGDKAMLSLGREVNVPIQHSPPIMTRVTDAVVIRNEVVEVPIFREEEPLDKNLSTASNIKQVPLELKLSPTNTSSNLMLVEQPQTTEDLSSITPNCSVDQVFDEMLQRRTSNIKQLVLASNTKTDGVVDGTSKIGSNNEQEIHGRTTLNLYLEEEHTYKQVMTFLSFWNNLVWEPGGLLTKHDMEKLFEECCKEAVMKAKKMTFIFCPQKEVMFMTAQVEKQRKQWEIDKKIRHVEYMEGKGTLQKVDKYHGLRVEIINTCVKLQKYTHQVFSKTVLGGHVFLPLFKTPQLCLKLRDSTRLKIHSWKEKRQCKKKKQRVVVSAGNYSDFCFQVLNKFADFHEENHVKSFIKREEFEQSSLAFSQKSTLLCRNSFAASSLSVDHMVTIGVHLVVAELYKHAVETDVTKIGFEFMGRSILCSYNSQLILGALKKGLGSNELLLSVLVFNANAELRDTCFLGLVLRFTGVNEDRKGPSVWFTGPYTKQQRNSTTMQGFTLLRKQILQMVKSDKHIVESWYVVSSAESHSCLVVKEKKRKSWWFKYKIQAQPSRWTTTSTEHIVHTDSTRLSTVFLYGVRVTRTACLRDSIRRMVNQESNKKRRLNKCNWMESLVNKSRSLISQSAGQCVSTKEGDLRQSQYVDHVEDKISFLPEDVDKPIVEKDGGFIYESWWALRTGHFMLWYHRWRRKKSHNCVFGESTNLWKLTYKTIDNIDKEADVILSRVEEKEAWVIGLMFHQRGGNTIADLHRVADFVWNIPAGLGLIKAELKEKSFLCCFADSFAPARSIIIPDHLVLLRVFAYYKNHCGEVITIGSYIPPTTKQVAECLSQQRKYTLKFGYGSLPRPPEDLSQCFPLRANSRLSILLMELGDKLPLKGGSNVRYLIYGIKPFSVYLRGRKDQMLTNQGAEEIKRDTWATLRRMSCQVISKEEDIQLEDKIAEEPKAQQTWHQLLYIRAKHHKKQKMTRWDRCKLKSGGLHHKGFLKAHINKGVSDLRSFSLGILWIILG